MQEKYDIAVFFEADVEKTRELGIDWQVLFQKAGLILVLISAHKQWPQANISQNQATPPHANISTDLEYTVGSFHGNTTAMFRFFETQNLGEIITSPSITVRDKQKGRIQVGSDFSIKQRDFSGNTIERFYSAGSIIEVTPYVYNKEWNKLYSIKSKCRKKFIPAK